jgi:hypothetical protein
MKSSSRLIRWALSVTVSDTDKRNHDTFSMPFAARPPLVAVFEGKGGKTGKIEGSKKY